MPLTHEVARIAIVALPALLCACETAQFPESRTALANPSCIMICTAKVSAVEDNQMGDQPTTTLTTAASKDVY